MTSRGRWTIVVIVAAAFALLPYVASRLPVGRSSITAAALLAKIRSSADVPFSGYAATRGALSLPAVDGFGNLAALFGGSSNLRLWWRGSDNWRVDAITLTGESDIAQDTGGLWQWAYESDHVSRSGLPSARVPRADDLAPGSLARRLLAQATINEVTRIPNARVAGQQVPGIELVPKESQSTITRVDVWALPSSGLPVRVAVHGRSNDGAIVSSTLLDLSTALPAAASTRFSPPPGVRVDRSPITDVVGGLNRYVHASLPAGLAGFARASGSIGGNGSVGVYGRGVTEFVTLPLPPRFADDVAATLVGSSAGATGGARTMATGPLTVRLTPRDVTGARWLLAGTVDAATLARAGAQLPAILDLDR